MAMILQIFMVYKPMKTHSFMDKLFFLHPAAFHGYFITHKKKQLQLSWVFHRIMAILW